MATELIASDRSISLQWNYKISKAYTGETIGYETQFLENIDSRLWEEDWNCISYDDASWENMIPSKRKETICYLQPTKLLEVYDIKPILIEQRQDGLWVDIGHEITGSPYITVKGKAGNLLRIVCGEELDDAGEVRYLMRCNCKYEEIVILNGRTITTDFYDYKAFRYMRLFFDNDVSVQDISIKVRHYPFDEKACTFHSSNLILNQIFEICKNGVRYGTQEGYLDCPNREKGQYLGDAIVTARAHVWLTGKVDMLEKCIDQFAQSTKICKGMMAVAPGGHMQEIADFSLLWSQLLDMYCVIDSMRMERRYLIDT